MKSKNIIVIDDHSDVLELLKYNLEKEKANVTTFNEGKPALDEIKKKRPDLIISDWMLDDIDGIDLCRIVKMDPETTHIPFIMLTGRNEEIDIVTALELGAEDYMVKPIRIKELITRCRKILQRFNSEPEVMTKNDGQREKTNEETENIVRYKDIKIYGDRYEVYINEKKLDLTYSEFKLLQLLVSKPGKVYTRSIIIEKLNGLDYFVTERAIDVQIVGLRRKLGLYKDFIKTVRGVGYSLND